MNWLALAALALICLTPLIFSLLRNVRAQGRRESAIGLYSAQLVELDRDLGEDRLSSTDYQSARLEIQRRLLGAADSQEAAPQTAGNPFLLLAALTLIPAGAFLLYLVAGSPGMPAAPHSQIAAALSDRAAQEEKLIRQLRARLAQGDPKLDQIRQGYVLLGNAEASRGNMVAATDAWQVALMSRFDATLAAQTGEALTEAAGHVTEDAAALFRQALASAPADAGWRPMAEKRLAEVAGTQGAKPKLP